MHVQNTGRMRTHQCTRQNTARNRQSALEQRHIKARYVCFVSYERIKDYLKKQSQDYKMTANLIWTSDLLASSTTVDVDHDAHACYCIVRPQLVLSKSRRPTSSMMCTFLCLLGCIGGKYTLTLGNQAVRQAGKWGRGGVGEWSVGAFDLPD